MGEPTKTEERDPGFSARVHQGHVDNFLRKVESAETREALQRLTETIGIAVERQFITDASRVELLAAIERQTQTLQSAD